MKASIPTLLAALLMAGCAGPPETPSPPDIVLVVLDTVRADHLGCYGYSRPTSPEIDAFAGGATRYARSVSSAPWTVPSHASMFTGVPPFRHGAHTFDVDKPGSNVNPLDLERLTLAEALDAEGYRTAAFVANAGFLAPHWQLDQGFETYVVERRYADEANRAIFAWLDERTEDDSPFFLFVNYIDAHRPYNTQPRPGFLDPPAEHGPELLDLLVETTLPGHRDADPALVRKVIDQYDTAIANLDEHVGELFERLARHPRFENALVVITSDHGEYFGEHRLVEHSKDVHQPVLNVPLILRHPGQTAGAVETSRVVSSDLPALIAARLPEPTATALRAAFPARLDAPVLSENYFTRRKDLFDPRWGHRFRRVRRAVFDGPFKYIHSSDGAHELYDLETDPHEGRNLVESEPEVAERLARTLEEYLQSDPAAGLVPSEPIDEELRERLEALGYVSLRPGRAPLPPRPTRGDPS